MTHDELRVNVSVVKEMDNLLQKHMKALESVMDLHKPTDWYGNDSLVCNYCFDLNYERTGLYMEPESFKYPCATIKAIEKELK